jgi:hypothetical protein
MRGAAPPLARHCAVGLTGGEEANLHEDDVRLIEVGTNRALALGTFDQPLHQWRDPVAGLTNSGL